MAASGISALTRTTSASVRPASERATCSGSSRPLAPAGDGDEVGAVGVGDDQRRARRRVVAHRHGLDPDALGAQSGDRLLAVCVGADRRDEHDGGAGPRGGGGRVGALAARADHERAAQRGLAGPRQPRHRHRPVHVGGPHHEDASRGPWHAGQTNRCPQGGGPARPLTCAPRRPLRSMSEPDHPAPSAPRLIPRPSAPRWSRNGPSSPTRGTRPRTCSRATSRSPSSTRSCCGPAES